MGRRMKAPISLEHCVLFNNIYLRLGFLECIFTYYYICIFALALQLAFVLSRNKSVFLYCSAEVQYSQLLVSRPQLADVDSDITFSAYWEKA